VKVTEIEAVRVRAADAQHGLLVAATAQRRQLDLSRDVHAVLGLVVDRTDLPGAMSHVIQCVVERRGCFLSTPNVNFVAAASRDPEFRGSVLRSDLSLADGFPIVRAARWMGVGLPGRVAGADLFEGLQASKRTASDTPIRLYLFGGPPGIAQRAAQRLNATSGGFECVGHDEAGFGNVEAMSDQATIDRINASNADFLLVALGAKKGQAWIEHNRYRLNPPVLSHLGAVINFAAGSVARAPVWVQRVGLEWAWRVGQEPQLWRRYWVDGRVMVHALLTQLLPWSLRRLTGRVPPGAGQVPRFEQRDEGTRSTHFALSGDWRSSAALHPLRHALAAALRDGRNVRFDLSAAPAVGSALLGLVALIDAWQVAPRALDSATLTDRLLLSDVRAHGMEHLLDVHRC
jgi:N-acetylglucosaminyldiphosphoundecaprenol N-acetyl-beta-D-mannosaminyltransferase